MANLTLSIDDEVLKRARIKALEQGTSVNALVREQLEDFAGTRDSQREAVERILEHAREHAAKTIAAAESTGRTWTREDLWEDMLSHRNRRSRPS